MTADSTATAPSMAAVRALRDRLGQWRIRTPVVRCVIPEGSVASGAEIWGKMAFLQVTGTFKPRGALANVLRLDEAGKKAGVTDGRHRHAGTRDLRANCSLRRNHRSDRRESMGILYSDMKMAVEPACAASTAALKMLGRRFAGKKVVLVFCGSNIDWAAFRRHSKIPPC